DFDDLSLMNYMPSPFRAFSMPYADDTQGIRSEYPSNAVSQTDLAVYLYYPCGYQCVSDAQYPPLVTAGQDLAFGSYRVENVGTTTINAPTVEWYLTSLRNFVSSYYYLGTATYDQAIPPNGKYDPSETTFT